MILGVFGLTAGLALGGLVVMGVLSHTLQRSVDTEAYHAADAVARLVDSEALPDPLPVAGGQVRVQVVDGQGRVRAASIDADRLVPMLYPGEMTGAGRYHTFVPGDRLGMADPVRVVAVTAGPPGDPLTVLVARSMSDVRHSVNVVRTILLIAFPLLVALLAVVAWRVVGATLRPVEALRAGAEEIAGSAGAGDGSGGAVAGAPGRLPVPASHDEIHRLAVTLNDMLDRLAAARARQRAFVADAAHELRSPLTNMRTELEVAQRLGERTDWPAVADNLLADTERLSRLVNDLLLLARLDDAGPRTGPAGSGRPVELGDLLTAVAARYPSSPPVRVDVPVHPVWTYGRPDELVRIVANLLDNAVRYAVDEVRVELAAGGPGADHRVTVTDDGPGIPVQDRVRVFDRFTRLDDARARDAGGAGLGLAIVRDLVRRQGGSVDLDDAAPGLRVTVRLPVAPEPTPRPVGA